MKLQILGVIDVKRLKTIRILGEKLKEGENREKADEIKLKIQELMDIDLLYKSYIVQEEVLKYELVNNIKKYLTKVITKITLSKSISIRIHIRDINMIEKAYNDIFGGVCVHDNQKRNAKIRVTIYMNLMFILSIIKKEIS
ncbi:hypothetical protein NEAUS06_2562 [Nematocida ausubeli]|nr:hypothetical protein NEAUS06_2562 [Nematocida ausubeli]